MEPLKKLLGRFFNVKGFGDGSYTSLTDGGRGTPLSGFSGTSGPSGLSGFSGFSGVSGSGISGFSGTRFGLSFGTGHFFGSVLFPFPVTEGGGAILLEPNLTSAR